MFLAATCFTTPVAAGSSMHRMIRTAGDVVTVLVGVLVLGVIVLRSFPPAPALPMELVDVRIDESVGIDFSTRAQTLVMVLDSECPFCQDSMPLYRRLTERDAPKTQIVVVAPPSDTRIDEYLAGEGVTPDAIVFADNEQLPVPGTPTLLLVVCPRHDFTLDASG